MAGTLHLEYRRLDLQRPKGAWLSAMLEIVVDIDVSSLYEIFDEANYFFQFISLD